VLRCCFSVLHRFLRPPHSSSLRLTPRRLSWKRRSHLTLSHSPFVYFVCASILFFCVASFPTPFAFLVAPSYTTSPVLEKTLSFDTLSFALCVLRLCFDVVFLCCIVSYALRIPRCSVLHHVACLGKDALI